MNLYTVKKTIEVETVIWAEDEEDAIWCATECESEIIEQTLSSNRPPVWSIGEYQHPPPGCLSYAYSPWGDTDGKTIDDLLEMLDEEEDLR